MDMNSTRPHIIVHKSLPDFLKFNKHCPNNNNNHLSRNNLFAPETSPNNYAKDNKTELCDHCQLHQQNKNWYKITEIEQNKKLRKKREVREGPIFVETAVFVDKDLFEHMKTNFAVDTEREVIRFVLAMINAVSSKSSHVSNTTTL